MILLAVLPNPAEAQLGALRRAAGKAVEQKAEDRSQASMLIEPTFDGTTVEITTERLDRYTAAMERLRTQRADNQRRYDALNAQANALSDSAIAAENDADRNSFSRASTTYTECRSGVERDAEAAFAQRGKEIAARMQRDPIGAQNDPQMKAMFAAMQELATAQQSGDSTALRRAQEKMARSTGAMTDSVSLDRAATTKCGARPAKPRSMVRAEALRARSDSTRSTASALFSSAGKVQGKDVGMTDLQAQMFWERIMSWLGGMKPQAPITRTFTKAEYDLLVARRGALRTAFSGG